MIDKVCIFPELTDEPINDSANFNSTAYWKILKPSIKVANPMAHVEGNFHGPTEDPSTTSQQPTKKNFEDCFICPSLEGKAKSPVFSRYKQRKLNVQKQPLSQDVPVKKGVANQGFIDHHQLDQTSPHTSSLKPLFATHSLQL